MQYLCMFFVIVNTKSLVIQTREKLLKSISGTLLAGLLAPYPSDAIISSKYCAGGVGDDCDELSQGNSYIKSLQEKSAMNRDSNLKVGVIRSNNVVNKKN
jgi:hypothetical protein